VLWVAGNGLLNPVDIGRDASDDRLPTAAEHEAVDTDQCPADVLLVFAHERTTTITLHIVYRTHTSFIS